MLTKLTWKPSSTAAATSQSRACKKLSRSQVVEDRQYAAELLLHSSNDENTSFLIELLNDPEHKVRKHCHQDRGEEA